MVASNLTKVSKPSGISIRYTPTLAGRKTTEKGLFAVTIRMADGAEFLSLQSVDPTPQDQQAHLPN
jgi:hypothetical protein